MNKNQELAPYLYHQGTNYEAYSYMGAHREGDVFAFRVWAPNADGICVVGDFNAWSDDTPMMRITEGGIWEALVPAERICDGMLYKDKTVALIGSGHEAELDVEFLRGICKEVLHFTDNKP